MSALFEQRLEQLASAEQLAHLRDLRRGIEKESLRITTAGKLAQTPHPAGLGSALANPYITTDYSEALLEFITPVSNSIEETLQTLQEIHQFSYSQMGEELLWGASMPCILEGDDNIPVALYGNSNVAKMKTVYRYGLGHRYGRLMQTIAGIHYNFSMPEAFWHHSWQLEGGSTSEQDYQTERYLGLIRNFQRYSWLLIYLFGASPAVCNSFLRGETGHNLQTFDDKSRSLYLPYATSLRMGDLGYQSNAQKDLAVCYNSIDSYIETLHSAITQPHAEYQAIGIGDNGHTRQLNTSLLQIENEFYSQVRPKRVANSGEIPLGALKRGGVEYIEVRCVDVNPFHPLGIDATQIRFLDTFLLFCLLCDSPPSDDSERDRISENIQRVVNRGREPGLQLQTSQGEQSLVEQAQQILARMAPLAELLDTANGSVQYSESRDQQARKIEDPGLTPSAKILADMEAQELPFFKLAMAYSKRWGEEFLEQPLAEDRLQHFQEVAAASTLDQQAIEKADSVDFEAYLAAYYQQYELLPSSSNL